MILELYSIKDTKVGFKVPFAQANIEQAKRTFKWLASDDESEIKKSPADFELWRTGVFDDVTGAIAGKPEFVMNGREAQTNDYRVQLGEPAGK